jgi:hypothetical protein
MQATLKLDVVQAVLGSFHFERIFLIEVAQFAEFLVTEERVVIEGHLSVESDELPFARNHARIDFEQ